MWVKDIQRLANLTNRSFPESAAEEIHFWSSIGEALEMTNTELRCVCTYVRKPHTHELHARRLAHSSASSSTP